MLNLMAWKKDTIEFGRPILQQLLGSMDINVLAFISNNKPKMLKAGPKRQAFLCPWVLV